MTTRTVNRIAQYEARRAVALDLMEHIHDKAIEKRLKTNARHTGYAALLTHRALTQLAMREAERNTR